MHTDITLCILREYPAETTCIMSEEGSPLAGSNETSRRTMLKTLGVAGAVTAIGVGGSVATAGTPNSASDAPTLQWHKLYPEWQKQASSSVLHSVIALGEGGYVTATTDMTFWKVNEDGETVWSKSIERDGSIHDMVQTSDGGYAFVGSATDDDIPRGNLTRKYGWILKTDESGSVQWSRDYGHNDDVELSLEWALATPDGGVLSVGNQHTPSNADKEGKPADQPFLVKLSADGDELWTKRTLGNRERVSACNLDVTADGNYLVRDFSTLWIFNPDGEVVRSRSFRELLVYDAIGRADGGTACVGKIPTGDPLTIHIVTTDREGSTEWHETYETSHSVGGLQIVERHQEFAIAGMTNGQRERNGEFFLLGAAKDGSRQWTTMFGEEEYDARLRDFIANGNAYILCGQCRPTGDNGGNHQEPSTIAKLVSTSSAPSNSDSTKDSTSRDDRQGHTESEGSTNGHDDQQESNCDI